VTPQVERLTRRLASAPPVFLAPLGTQPIAIAAVVADLFRDRATRRLTPAEVAKVLPAGASAARLRHLQLVLLATWLLHDEAFSGSTADALLALLEERLAALAAAVVPRKFVEDAERREELVRTCLAALAVIPEGESPTFAEDRLAALDSVRRKELLREAKEREGLREAERARRRKELELLRAQEEEERRQAARSTHED
jgi:hypothetical protein